ncbi:P-loop containing nucleoside triphosphate hydrolase protein [Melampsora americana]|nr:P-loop containing nucleoside triphosphate hydrolase protein [Melampsora americana]
MIFFQIFIVAFLAVTALASPNPVENLNTGTILEKRFTKIPKALIKRDQKAMLIQHNLSHTRRVTLSQAQRSALNALESRAIGVPAMPLTRSKSMPNLAPNLTQKREPKASKRVTLPKYIINATTDKVRESIIDCSRDHYKQDPHEKQVDATISLVRGQNTFLLAGTGFGKSRVVELFLLLFAKVRNPIVLVLNPLDALGDNQVADKIKNKFTAINLTQLSFCHQVVVDILAGKYQFVYLSPEIFLNSPLFIKLYFNEEFQNRLVLKVVDEAHLIYSWGLVASGLARRSASWLKVQDVGVFRPSYGNLCARLTATEYAPVLLMSATCRPKSFNAILKNLRWRRHRDVTEVRADLVQYEIRFIRLTMQHTLQSAKDLHRFFPPAVDVPDCDLPRTLIYSGTQNHTEKTMKVVNAARKRTQDSKNGRSSCARRFHADTGAEDKLERGMDFVAGFLAVICCTMALGLGQNWGIVQRVIVVGRADPATLCQMLGRCGRDQKPGLGFMLVERGRRGGKNRVEDFKNFQNMSYDDRMDALAITPVCLRVAFAIDNNLGYIPLHFDDPEYMKEYERQNKVAPCLCSNCRADLVLGLMHDQLRLTQSNFNDIVTETLTDTSPQVKPTVHHSTKTCTILTCPASDKIRSSPPFQVLQTTLLQKCDALYHQQFPRNDNFLTERDMLTEHQAWRISKNSDVLGKSASLREILGSEALDGQFDCILQTIKDWEQSDIFKLTGRQRAALSKARVQKANQISPISSQPKRRLTVPTILQNHIPEGHEETRLSHHDTVETGASTQIRDIPVNATPLLAIQSYAQTHPSPHFNNRRHEMHHHCNYHQRFQQSIAQQQSASYNHRYQVDYSWNERYPPQTTNSPHFLEGAQALGQANDTEHHNHTRQFNSTGNTNYFENYRHHHANTESPYIHHPTPTGDYHTEYLQHHLTQHHPSQYLPSLRPPTHGQNEADDTKYSADPQN